MSLSFRNSAKPASETLWQTNHVVFLPLHGVSASKCQDDLNIPFQSVRYRVCELLVKTVYRVHLPNIMWVGQLNIKKGYLPTFDEIPSHPATRRSQGRARNNTVPQSAQVLIFHLDVELKEVGTANKFSENIYQSWVRRGSRISHTCKADLPSSRPTTDRMSRTIVRRSLDVQDVSLV